MLSTGSFAFKARDEPELEGGEEVEEREADERLRAADEHEADEREPAVSAARTAHQHASRASNVADSRRASAVQVDRNWSARARAHVLRLLSSPRRSRAMLSAAKPPHIIDNRVCALMNFGL